MIKQLPPMQVLFFSTQTTLASLGEFVGNIAEELFQQAAKEKILPSGPIQWIYYGADGKPDTKFLLEIALPLTLKPKDTGRFQFKELPAFTGMSRIHKGEWKYLFETYEQLMDAVAEGNHSLSGICREQYLYIDFVHPENQQTEVIVGTKE